MFYTVGFLKYDLMICWHINLVGILISYWFVCKNFQCEGNIYRFGHNQLSHSAYNTINML